MFRITRGISLDHSPAFPNPSFRFPNGTALPIHGEDDADPALPPPAEASNGASDAQPAASTESSSAAPP